MPDWLTDEQYDRYFNDCSPISAKEDDSSNPVRTDGRGSWFFYDEDWNLIHGPYETYYDAAVAAVRYAESL